MYQNVITATNPEISRKNVGIKSGKKNKRATRKKIIRSNLIVAK